MKGSHRKVRGSGRSTVWELRVYAGRSPVTHKAKYISRTVTGTAKQRDDTLRDLIEEVGRVDHAGPAETFGAFLDRWLKTTSVLKDRSPTTVREYRRIIDKTIKPALGNLALRDIDGAALDDLYVALRTRKPPLSPASVRRVHALVSSACGWAVKRRELSSNPADQASPPSVIQTPKTAPTPDEVLRMLAEAYGDDPDMAVFIAVAAATGARRGELLGLIWQDVDWDQEMLTVGRSVAVVSGEWIKKDTKTHTEKMIPLTGITKDGEVVTFALDTLRAHRALMEERALEAGATVTDEMPVFTYNMVDPINPDTASHYVRAIATRAGVDAHLHQLRHFAGTYLIGGDVDLATTQNYLGHRPGSPITLKFYAHPLPEGRRGAAAVLGKVLMPSPEKVT